MLAGIYHFQLQRGADFTRLFRKRDDAGPVNLTGLKVRCQFRSLAGETGTTTSTTLVLELPNADGVEITDATAGEITLALTTAETLTLCPANVKTTLAYGIELYDDAVSPNAVIPLLQGKVTVLPETVR